KKLLLLGIGKDEIAAIGWLVATSHFRHIAEGFGALGDKAVRAGSQIRADVGRFADDWMLGVGVVVINALVGGIRRAEANDDNVDVGLPTRFAFPSERAVGKVNLHAEATKQQSPDDWHLLTLRDGVGGDEAHADLRPLDVLSGPVEPRNNVVHVAGVLEVTEHHGHIGPLVGALIMLPHKRRVAEDVGALFGREDSTPFGAE